MNWDYRATRGGARILPRRILFTIFEYNAEAATRSYEVTLREFLYTLTRYSYGVTNWRGVFGTSGV